MFLAFFSAVGIIICFATSVICVKLVLQLDRKLDYAINNIFHSQAEILSYSLSALDIHGRVEPSLVASVTTTRDRLNLVHVAIQSIMMQSVRPCSVNLYISDEIEEKDIPCSLIRLRQWGLFIHFVPDVGPHTKLIYALQQFPNDMIVTFDDDMIYPSNALDCLLKTHRKYPHAIAANWVREIPFDWRGRAKCIKKGRLLTPASLCNSVNQKAYSSRPSHRAFAYGTGGVLYPPHALDPRVQDVDAFRTLCPTEDDIWFKAMAILAGTPVAPTNLGIKPKHHNVRGSQFTALRHQNYKNSRNQQQMRAAFEAFDLLDHIKQHDMIR